MIELVQKVIDHLSTVLRPLRAAATARDVTRTLLDSLGWDLDELTGAPVEEILDGVAALGATLDELDAWIDQPPTTLAEAQSALAVAQDLISEIDALQALLEAGAHPPELEDFFGELLEAMALTYMRGLQPVIYRLAILLGVIERAAEVGLQLALVDGSRVLRKPRVRDRLHLDRLTDLVSDPIGTLRAEYLTADGLSTVGGARATAEKLFPRLAEFLAVCGLDARYGIKTGYGYDFGDASEDVKRMLAVRLDVDGSPLSLGVVLALEPGVGGAQPGVLVSPWGAGDLTSTVGTWQLTMHVGAGVDGLLIKEDAVDVEGAGVLDLGFTATRAAAAPAAGALFDPGEVKVAATLGVDHGETVARLAASVTGAKLVIGSPAAGDSLLARVAPSSRTTATFDASLDWQRGRGLRFGGSLDLEATIPVNAGAAGLRVEAVRLGLRADGDAISVEAGADLRLEIGPVTLGVENLGLAARFDLGQPQGNLGLADLSIAPRWPDGGSIAIRTSVVDGGGRIAVVDGGAAGGRRYEGALALDVLGVAISAIGVFDTRGPGYSLAAVVSSQFHPVPIGLGFTLDGVGGLIGIHRRVDADALRAALRGPGIGDIFFADDPVAHAARLTGDLATFFPAAQGRHVFGPAVRIGWGTPTVIEGTLALLLEVPSPVRLILLGSVSASLPTKDAPIIALHVDVLGVVDFAGKTLAIDASLRDSKVAGFPITGDLALRMGWGDPPSFCLSVGGFHSQFRPPPGFPALRRVQIPIGAGDNPRLDIQGFLALTSNTAQVGASVDLYAAAGPLNVVGSLGFEALIQFVPFSFQVDLWAGVALRRGTHVLAGVHLDGTLRGPTPWHFAGEACLSLWFIDLCVSFDATFGEAQDVELPAHDIWPALEAALEDPRSWSTAIPPAAARAVTTATPAGAATRIDPVSALSVRQKVVPLNRKIERFAQVAPSGITLFEVTNAMLGTATFALPPLIDDWFAPAQFEALTDDERLSRAGYEKMVAGITLVSDEVTTGAVLIKQLAYETIVFPDPEPLPVLYQPTLGMQLDGIATGVNATAPLRDVATLPLVTLEEEAFVIASTFDLTPRLDITTAVGRGAVELALKAYLAANPSARGALHVVPRFEVQELMP